MVSILLFKLGLWDGLMAPSLGMTMEQTGLSSSERTFICSISIFFICFMIWINFHHKTGRVGRRPTEPLFFSFMAGWEKERGQWFQHALVGIPFDPIPLKCLSYHFSFYTKSSSDQNSRVAHWGRWQLHGFQEEGSWREDVLKVCFTWNSAICMKYILVWIPSVGQMTELMDSLSSSDDRIGGFPQQVGCWNCQKVDSLSRSEDRIRMGRSDAT